MDVPEPEYEVPTWIAALLLVAFAGSIVYGLLVARSLIMPITIWLWLLGAGLSVFVVYLFHRFVLAVETIAEKL